MSDARPDIAFHHGGVSVADLDRAIAWYNTVLGFEVEMRFAIPPANAEVAMIRRGDVRMELFGVVGAAALPTARREPISDLQTQGNKHVAFRIRDLDAFLADVKVRGADVAMVVDEDFGRGCFLRDDTGNLIEFVETKA